MRRRVWLLSGLATGGALLVGWSVLPSRGRLGSATSLPTGSGAVALNGWLKLDLDGHVLLAMNRSEMGQGVHTALSMIVAEELDVPLSRVRLVSAGGDALYGNVALFVARARDAGSTGGFAGGLPMHARWARHVGSHVGREFGLNLTGGSTSVSDAWDVLRLAAATARSQLLNAASLEWRLPVAELTVSDGVISHPSGRRAPYQVHADRARLAPPSRVEPKTDAEWSLIGRPLLRVDGAIKANGRAVFGIDERMPGQLFAAVRHAPLMGGSPGRFDAAAALRLPGVVRVVRLPPYGGAPDAVAVVGISQWHAQRGLDALRIEWRPPPGTRADSTRFLRALEREVLEAGFTGDGDTTPAGTRLVAVYRLPYLAHAALEPVNATARVADGKVQVWVSTQVPGLARATAARVAGVDEAQVSVDVSYLGGSFGRRLETEIVAQAVRIAQECGGRPVQAMWSRDQDFANDVFRPAAVVLLQADVDADGRAQALRSCVASDAVTPRWVERNLPQLALPVELPRPAGDGDTLELPYAIAGQRRVEIDTRGPIPVGYWRSLRHSACAFAVESFVDELAAAAGEDPVRFRLSLLEARPRHAAVLTLAAERAGWPGFDGPRRPLATGRALGAALHASHGSIVAQVAEVSLQGGQVRVHRVVVAADVGIVVNPQLVAQQLESGVVCGLSAALHGRIDVVDGAVAQTGFDRYRLLTMAETPHIETHLLASSGPPGGVGEIANPPIAPAVANALFVLTDRRWRDLPFAAASAVLR